MSRDCDCCKDDDYTILIRFRYDPPNHYESKETFILAKHVYSFDSACKEIQRQGLSGPENEFGTVEYPGARDFVDMTL